MASKHPRRPRTNAVTGGQAYKKGESFKVARGRTDQVLLGTTTSVQDLAEQHRIMLSLKTETTKQLKVAQATTRRLEQRENLLRLAESVDKTVEVLTRSLQTLQDLAARFAIFSANSQAAIIAEAQKFS